ncbi:hypothetical protein CTA1_12171 [Colletotrichum tanaceti]|uniref:Uncharacterized protein n=1 Tax=Colletotrichum tanaceti TaxID=1306861 RepID=A0A4U6X744_9PEZI|nr:hypothetical protein CTA1_12171 [Colletotrichum tanaceti]
MSTTNAHGTDETQPDTDPGKSPLVSEPKDLSILHHDPPFKALHPKPIHFPPPRRSRIRPLARPSKLRYIDGLPVLPRTDAERAAARTRLPPVYFCDHTPGKCLHCTLAGTPCTFTRVTPSAPCGRCRRLGQVCLVRRPGSAERIITGEDAADWAPVGRAVEILLGEDGALALAGRAMEQREEAGGIVVFGERVTERDARGWCLPRVIVGGGG